MLPQRMRRTQHSSVLRLIAPYTSDWRAGWAQQQRASLQMLQKLRYLQAKQLAIAF
jgi:hypothetical protein